MRIVSATSWPTVRSPGGSGGGSSGTERLEERRHGRAQELDSVRVAPEGAVRLGDLVDDGAELDCGNAGELARAQHGEALHGLDLAVRRAVHTRARPDRRDACAGERGTGALEQGVVGTRARTDER